VFVSATESVTAAVDVAALRQQLDGPNAEVRDRVREALGRPEFAPVIDMPDAEYREHVMGLVKLMADEGVTGLAYPEQYGGEGAVGASIAGFETLAMGDLSLVVKVGVQFGLFGGAVLHLGTEKHHAKYLKAIADVELPGCFAMSESGHGSNVQEARTTATYDPDTREFVVHSPDVSARKDYIGNAAVHGRMAAVFCQLVVGGEKRGVHCVLVPIRDEEGNALPGVTITDNGHKLGLNGVDNGQLMFDEVRVPRDNLLDRYATVSEDGVYESPIENPNRRFFTMLGTLIQGRVSVGGAGINASKVALVIAVKHALRRRQFGPPDQPEALLLDYRVHQRRLLPHLATAYALHFAQDETRDETHRAFTEVDYAEADQRRLETRAAALKAIATWHCTRTVQECREACGGAGYIAKNRFAALKADSDVFTTFEGDNIVMRQLVAKNLLTDFRDELGELEPLGTASFFAGQAFNIVAERTAARELVGRIRDELRPGDEEGKLRNRQWQLDMFRWREEHLTSSAARRLKGLIDNGGDPFETLLDTQDHLLEVARVHTERIVLESFAAAVDACPHAPTRRVLDQLCDLFALWHIESDRGWFQEHGRLSSKGSKAVIKAVGDLCKSLRQHAGPLVEAFGVPEAQLAGTLADPATHVEL
jgi:acyl-CoA oxidase